MTAMPVVIARLHEAALSGIPGPRPCYMQPVQDIQIGARVSRTQYQYTLTDTDAAELASWTPRLIDRLRPLARTGPRDQRPAGRGSPPKSWWTAIVATRLGVTMQAIEDVLYDAFGQRQVSTIYQQSNQYRVVMRPTQTGSADPARWRNCACAGHGAPASAPTGAAQVFRHQHGGEPRTRWRRCRCWRSRILVRRTAPLVITHQSQFPAATISFDVRAGALAGPTRWPTQQAERDIGMPATIIGAYSGDAAEFQRLAGRRTVADPGRGGGDLHRARRALRELHPPGDDPVHAAVRRHRRAAGADAFTGRTCPSWRWWASCC